MRGDGILAAIDEMLARLESVTNAGQRHLMQKIVSALVAHPLAASAGAFVIASFEDLRREVSKAAPDGGAFERATRTLIAQYRMRQ
jgi:hypothetical protein